MKPRLQIPVLVDVRSDNQNLGTVGEPATLREKIRSVAQTAISQLILDEESIDHCLKDILAFVRTMDEKIRGDRSLSLDSLSLQLAVTGTGQLAFFGTGTEVSAAAVFQVTLKIRQQPSILGDPV